MIGFTFNTVHCYTTYSIVAKSVNRPILPQMRKREISVMGKHGAYDFEDNTYESRIITVSIQYMGSSFTNLRSQARSIAAWLSQTTYKNLIFDDEPTKYYLAKIYNEVGFENFLRLGKGTIQFECQPYAISTTLYSGTTTIA